jgi:hypothetical protein
LLPGVGVFDPRFTFSELADTHDKTGWMADAVQPVFIFVLVKACLTSQQHRIEA